MKKGAPVELEPFKVGDEVEFWDPCIPRTKKGGPFGAIDGRGTLDRQLLDTGSWVIRCTSGHLHTRSEGNFWRPGQRRQHVSRG